MKHLKEILELSVEQKISLVETLWDSISIQAKQDSPLSPNQLQDLIQRNAELEANPDNGLSWKEAKAQIRSGKWRTL